MFQCFLNIKITLDFPFYRQIVPSDCGNALCYQLSKIVSFFNTKPGIGSGPVSRLGCSGGVAAKYNTKHGDTARVSF